MKRYLLALILVFSHISGSYAGDPVIEEKINILNAASIKSLGISLNALSYLVNSSPYGYMPLSLLEESGRIEFINELEQAGYVVVTTRIGLPDGQEPLETFINIRPLKTGKEIQRCLQALRHNNHSQQDDAAASPLL